MVLVVHGSMYSYMMYRYVPIRRSRIRALCYPVGRARWRRPRAAALAPKGDSANRCSVQMRARGG